eukprot:symbB.v1.2.018563.t1/scaffold1467.1/size117085/7
MFGIACCRCTEGTDDGEAPAEEDVLPISTLSNVKVNNSPPKGPKEKNTLAESGKKLHACARTLSSRLEKDQADVWKKAGEEFNCQKLIWQSLGMKGGEKLKGAAAMIESKLEFSMASHTKDLTAAIEALDACLEKNEGLDLLSMAMFERIQEIKKSVPRAAAVKELTILLDRAAEELAGGTVSRRGADLEQSSLSGCGIEESKLESAIKAAWKAAYD